MKSKKGFELSVNMIVVMILGLILLGVGFSIFNTAYNKTVEVRENVDTSTQQQLNSLLDSGDPLAIPINNKDVGRGDYVDFNIGLGNELGEEKIFSIYITFATTGTAVRSVLRPNANIQGIISTDENCPSSSIEPSSRNCGDLWVLMLDDFRHFKMANNERQFIPIRVQVPRSLEDIGDLTRQVGIPPGQYIFNVDVCVDEADEPEGSQGCKFSSTGEIENRYFSRQKLYVNVN